MDIKDPNYDDDIMDSKNVKLKVIDLEKAAEEIGVSCLFDFFLLLLLFLFRVENVTCAKNESYKEVYNLSVTLQIIPQNFYQCGPVPVEKKIPPWSFTTVQLIITVVALYC